MSATHLLEAFARSFLATLDPQCDHCAPVGDDVREVEHHIRCGLHSGFPVCCIAFFIVEKRRWEPGSDVWREYSAALASAARAAGKMRRRTIGGRRKTVPDIGYAPCPKCIEARRFVRVKSCPKSCVPPRRTRS
jgi:hypothetical protein